MGNHLIHLARAERARVGKDERAPGRLGLLLGWALEGVILMSHTIWALSTGMRQAELFGLRWQDVDLEKSALSVTTTVQRSRSAGLLIKEPKTATSRRRIALATGEQFSVVEALRAHRARQLEERLAAGPT